MLLQLRRALVLSWRTKLGGKRRISVEEMEEVKEMVDLWPEVERLLVAEAEGMKEAEETTAILEWKFVRMDFD